MQPKVDIAGEATLLGEGLPTDLTIAADGARAAPASRPEGPFRIGRYTAVRQLGAGGMGVVYMAYDEQLDRKVAVKLLQGRPTADHASLGRSRLMREAQAMAHVSHPNVAAVYEVGEFEEQVFVAMEFVEGQTLGAWLSGQVRGWREVVDMFAQAGRGLAAAHAAGLVHRDFKPDNVIVGDDGRARVLDFGLARASRELQTQPPELPEVDMRASSSLSARLTQAGSLVGTPAYMAPEQYMRAGVDARSDQFSFCVSLYEALYGARPFSGQTLPELMASVTRGKVQVPKQHRPVPAWLHEVVVRGLDVDPEQRWPDMPTLLARLARDPARRRRRVAAQLGGLALLVAAVVVALRQGPGRAQVCTGAAAQLAGVWDPPRRAAVDAALAATGLPYAPAVAARVAASLDAYAAAWTAAHTQACEATAVRREQSQEMLGRRMACLDQRRAALRALVDVLAGADAAVAETAAQAADALPRLDPCADAAYLQARVRPPDDPGVAARVDAARERLARAHAEVQAGKYADARASAEALAGAAAATGYAPLQAEVDRLRGELAVQAGKYADAEARLRGAYVGARAAGHDEVATATATALLGLTGGLQARFDAASAWRAVAAAEVQRGGDPLAEADLAYQTGHVALREGDYARAEAELTRALELRTRVVGADHSSLLRPLNQLGSALEKQGKYAAAAERYRRAMALAEAALAPDHPLVADAADNLGEILQSEGRYEDARAQHLRGLEIRERALGREALQVAESLNNLGIVAESLGRPVESVAHFRRVLEIQEKTLGAEAPQVALTHANLGALLHLHADEAAAREHLERALQIQERTLAPDHPETVFARANLGLVARAQGRPGDALAHLAKALAVTEKALGPEHANAASIRQNLASVLQELGRADEALAELGRAREIRAKALGPAHPEVALLRVDIADALARQRKDAAAEAELRGALAELEAALGADHPDLADALVALVDLLLRTGREDQALAPAERALRLRTAETSTPRELAAARFAVARALVAGRGDRTRARALAREAREGYPDGSPERAAVDRWLARAG